jgi:hypothetical protein
MARVLLSMADDGQWNETALTLILVLIAFGFCYSWWRHVGSGRRIGLKGRGFEVKPITGLPARADTKEDDHHG